jgi:oligopeptide/dipeptide ABC transporter ATP-binding protein
MMQADTLLEVRDLSTTFLTPNGPVRAVDGVTFTVHRGTSLGIVGESGSGKSVMSKTIMRLLSRHNATFGGEVLYKGRDILSLSVRQMRKIWAAEMAMVFQDPTSSLHPLKRIGDQIVEVLREHQGITRGEAKRRSTELLEALAITEPKRRVAQYPHELSGGMRQRISIAIALACDPDVLFADEPTTALDVTVQEQILNLLGHHQYERHMAMILVTHDLGVVAGRTRDLIVMYAGQVVESGPTRAVLSAPKMPYTDALLRSAPRLDAPPHHRIEAIEGRPPNPLEHQAGCRFADRCAFARDHCRQTAPPLVHEGGRAYRCFYPLRTERDDAAVTLSTPPTTIDAGADHPPNREVDHGG